MPQTLLYPPSTPLSLSFSRSRTLSLSYFQPTHSLWCLFVKWLDMVAVVMCALQCTVVDKRGDWAGTHTHTHTHTHACTHPHTHLSTSCSNVALSKSHKCQSNEKRGSGFFPQLEQEAPGVLHNHLWPCCGSVLGLTKCHSAYVTKSKHAILPLLRWFKLPWTPSHSPLDAPLIPLMERQSGLTQNIYPSYLASCSVHDLCPFFFPFVFLSIFLFFSLTETSGSIWEWWAAEEWKHRVS